MIYNNCFNVAQTNCNFVDGNKLAEFFMVEKTLQKENEDLLEKVRYFEEIKSLV
jgi:hypothetical protein